MGRHLLLNSPARACFYGHASHREQHCVVTQDISCRPTHAPRPIRSQKQVQLFSFVYAATVQYGPGVNRQAQLFCSCIILWCFLFLFYLYLLFQLFFLLSLFTLFVALSLSQSEWNSWWVGAINDGYIMFCPSTQSLEQSLISASQLMLNVKQMACTPNAVVCLNRKSVTGNSLPDAMCYFQTAVHPIFLTLETFQG